MPMIPVGPYRTVTTGEGVTFPYYVIPFDKQGSCEGPRTLEHLLANAPGHSDVFLFSHGWNNDWSVATKRYEDFISGFMRLRSEWRLAPPEGYRPLLAGVFWPSQALSWFESETGPEIAATDPRQQDDAARASSDLLKDVAAALPPAQRPRFYELAQAEELGEPEAAELASTLASLLGGDDEASLGGPPSAADLLAAAGSLVQEEPDYEAVGTATAARSAPRAAGGGGFLKKLDPRNLIKPFTVWQMKDRAGKVGANGVAELLVGLLGATHARVHLVGHSFGCKVVMSATCAPASLPRKVESALLLQPAVSQYAFSGKVPERNVPGGFAKALQRIETPILSTYSSHDGPLTRMFHLAVRRHDDLGELQIAADGTPSRFAALGGFGPQDSNAVTVAIQDPPTPYDLSGTGRIIGVKGDRTIMGHGEISIPSTWWAAYSLVMAHRARS